jgi:small GTP-binding protein
MNHNRYRYIIIGDSEVGKSSILLQFTEEQFNDTHEMTIGVEMGSRSVQANGKQIKLEIWDTAGQESYLSITRSYYRGADGCLLVFDISSKTSFENLSMWLSEARQNSNNPNLVILMIGNKADLETTRQVSSKEASDFAVANGLQFMELSAKNYKDVEDAFVRTASLIDLKKDEYVQARANGIKLSSNSNHKENTKNSKKGGADCCK